ncbi:antitoxin [Litchfieldella qijiaojingensis]|uniref:Antitoxin n=1 Tax=Litchfieldella qijiaojingensis TaxID=980347 RepID=A0ABQ2Z9T7_9GAMM|nr:type II toxin-antitoxin system prevent-host-death family antitoxin [Halomonas qijiaojingensis]GGY09674.1 antitoxin [Halomonas qijiaojingensis]
MKSTMTSREFNHDASRAKRAARQGPVIITERGKPSHVLLSYEEYEKLRHSKDGQNIIELLADTDASEVEFEPQAPSSLVKDVDLD